MQHFVSTDELRQFASDEGVEGLLSGGRNDEENNKQTSKETFFSHNVFLGREFRQQDTPMNAAPQPFCLGLGQRKGPTAIVA